MKPISMKRAFLCVAMLSLVRCEAELTDAEVGSLAEPLAVGHSDTGSTCGAGDGCKPDCAIPDNDCTTNHDDKPDDPKTTWSLTGPVSRTGISGYPGSLYIVGVPDSEAHGVYAILSNERSDEPCYVSIATEDLNDAKNDFVSNLDMCGPKSYSDNSVFLHADYLDTDAGGADNHIFVNAVNVCMNSNYDKVKGIAVTGVKLSSNGTLVSVLDSAADTRNNCDGRWVSWEYCPLGQIATAVDLHFAAGTSPRDLTGIALECRKVAQ